MKNPERPGAAQRPYHPATGSAQRSKGPEPVPHIRYAMRALQSTAIAFMAPTIVAPLMPAPLRPWRFLACGLLYADQQQQPSDMRFNPILRKREHTTGILLGLLPFIPAITLQAHLTETWCATKGSLGKRIAGTSEHAWSSFWQRFPKRVAEVAGRYPINFVLARCAAQFVASIAGSTLSATYYRARGHKLVARKQPLARRSLQQRVEARPELYAAGGLLFVVPALFDTRLVWAELQKHHVPRAAVNTVVLVGAALTTAEVIAQQRA